MKQWRISTVTLAVSIIMAFCLNNAARADDFIAKFNGTSKVLAGGKAIMTVSLSLITSGKSAIVPVPNEPEEKDAKPVPGPPMPTPKKDLADAIGKLSPGQIVKVTVVPDKYLGKALDSIEPYETKPGEDTPNGYVFSKSFDKTVGSKTVTTVVLTKFGAEHNFTIALKKGDKGEQVPDPDVLDAINKLQPDSAVWVQTQGKTSLAAIEPYTDPKSGTITSKDDAAHTADIQTDDGKSMSVMLPGKESAKADPTLLAQFGKAKKGSAVLFRVHADGDKNVLRELLIEKPGAKKPADMATTKPTTKP